MPWIHFAKKNQPSLQVPAGSNLMQVLLENKIPVSSSCHGDGVCGKCRLQVQADVSSLSPLSEVERHLIAKNAFAKDVRISCQCVIYADITVDAGYW